MAWKWLNRAGRDRLSFQWPLPSSDRPGEWTDGNGAHESLRATSNVCFAITRFGLCDHMHARLFEAECGNRREYKNGFVLCDRIRLTKEVLSWNCKVMLQFARACLRKTLDEIALREELRCRLERASTCDPWGPERDPEVESECSSLHDGFKQMALRSDVATIRDSMERVEVFLSRVGMWITHEFVRRGAEFSIPYYVSVETDYAWAEVFGDYTSKTREFSKWKQDVLLSLLYH